MVTDYPISVLGREFLEHQKGTVTGRRDPVYLTLLVVRVHLNNPSSTSESSYPVQTSPGNVPRRELKH